MTSRLLLAGGALVAAVLWPLRGHAWQTLVAGTPPEGRPSAVGVDAAGDVIAVGRSVNAAGDEDALLVKLSGHDGTEAWRHVWAGSAPGNDVLRALATGPTAVVVVGQLANAGTASDALVAKLAPDGGLAWEAVLDGGAGRDDDALAVALDGSGDVVVAGRTTLTGTTSARFAVRKLAGAGGGELWHAELAEDSGTARAVAIEGGDVIAAGDVGGVIVVTRRAGADGAQLWRTSVAGSTGAVDIGRVLAVGGGRAVVAGRMVSADGDPDFAVVALDVTTGTEVWRFVLDGAAVGAQDSDDAFGVAVDPAGDVIAVGRLSDLGVGHDGLAVKLAGASGAEVWRTVLNGRNNANDLLQAVALDPAGNALVVGSIRNPGTRADLLLAKLSGATGAEAWRREIDGDAHMVDSGAAVAAGAGDLVGTGRLVNVAAPGDVPADGFVVVKLAGATGGAFPCGNGTPDAGEVCDDGNVAVGDGCRPDCTAEICGDGILDPEETCDDGNTEGGDCCSATCSLEADGSGCSDGDACTLGDACQAGTCVPTGAIECPVPGACYQASCTPADGSCVVTPKAPGALCDDQNACTVLDRCVAAVCTGTIAPNCDDHEPCTADGCDPVTGCTNTPLDGFPSISCVFARPDLQSGCTAGLPHPLQIRLTRAEHLLSVGAQTPHPRRARRALANATKAVRQALRITGVQLRHRAISDDCAEVLDHELNEVMARADEVRTPATR